MHLFILDKMSIITFLFCSDKLWPDSIFCTFNSFREKLNSSPKRVHPIDKWEGSHKTCMSLNNV